jgi:hypothetical protein
MQKNIYDAHFPVVTKTRKTHQNYRREPIGLFWYGIVVKNRAMIYGYARVPTDGQSVTAEVR